MIRIALAALCLTGCAKTVEVRLPASPAVEIVTPRVAVVAAQRPCREFADALVVELGKVEGLLVDPAAPTTLQVHSCAQPFLPPEIEVEVGADASRQRVVFRGAAHAMVAVVANGAVRANVLGADRKALSGEWNDGRLPALARDLHVTLVEAVAQDLAEQIAPFPRLVERRLYPNAPDESARGLLHQAVMAELAGDLDTATRLARRASTVSPSPDADLYLSELERRARRFPTPP